MKLIFARQLQSVKILAQGVPSQSETIVTRIGVTSEAQDEPKCQETSSGKLWTNVFRGSMDLPPLPISFIAPNLDCSYTLVFDFSVSTSASLKGGKSA